MLTTTVSNFETRLFFSNEQKSPNHDEKIGKMRPKRPCQGCGLNPKCGKNPSIFRLKNNRAKTGQIFFCQKSQIMASAEAICATNDEYQ